MHFNCSDFPPKRAAWNWPKTSGFVSLSLQISYTTVVWLSKIFRVRRGHKNTFRGFYEVVFVVVFKTIAHVTAESRLPEIHVVDGVSKVWV